jgi:hypothetical protein
LVGSLRARATVKIHDHVQPSISAPSDNLIKILKSTPGIKFAFADKVFTNPETDRDADSVEAQAVDLLNIGLGHPSLPVLSKGSIGSILAKTLHALPFVVGTTAAHAVPFITCHPGLDNKLGTEIDTSNLVGSRKPSRQQFGLVP